MLGYRQNFREIDMKTLLTTLAILLSPAMAAATCSGFGHADSANQCAAGQVWDAESNSCVAVTSS